MRLEQNSSLNLEYVNIMRIFFEIQTHYMTEHENAHLAHVNTKEISRRDDLHADSLH